jgi:hypothetical protein
VMEEIFNGLGIDHKTYVTRLNHQGITINS